MPYGDRTPYFKVCPVCSKKFKLAHWELETKKTCGFQCSKLYKKTLKISKETRQKISKIKKGKYLKEESSQWKGNNASYASQHEWIRINCFIPDKCEMCNEPKKLDAASVNHKYERDCLNYKWLCRKCHFKFDGKDSNYFRKLQENQIKNKKI